MEEQFWRDKWTSNQIAFHNDEANPLLVKHFHELGIQQGAHIFVPLCGKSRDLLWLAQQGLRVTGAELSRVAVTQFFAESGLEPAITTAGSLQRYESNGIVIFQGSVFDLTTEMLGPVDVLYDRAALVALPQELRDRYAAHLVTLTATAPQLLIAYEYEQSCIDGPPFSVSEEEVHRLYATTFEIQLLERAKVEGGLKGQCPASEAVWKLTQTR